MYELENGDGFIPSPYSCVIHDVSLRDKSGRCKPCRSAVERARHQKNRENRKDYDTTCGVCGGPKITGLHCEKCKRDANRRHAESNRDKINEQHRRIRVEDPERYNRYQEKAKAKGKSDREHERLDNPVKCVECGAEFILQPPKCFAKYCSDRCRFIAQKRNKKLYPKPTPEKVAEYNRRGYEKHHEKRLEDGKKYYWENRDVLLIKQKKYRDENQERHRAAAIQWQKDNPDKVAARGHRRRARKVGAMGDYTADQFNLLCTLLGKKCFDCGDVTKLEVGHAIPLARGGSNWIDNIIPQCRSCNASQNTKLHPQFVIPENALSDMGLITI